jgi:hypothetical protein
MKIAKISEITNDSFPVVENYTNGNYIPLYTEQHKLMLQFHITNVRTTQYMTEMRQSPTPKVLSSRSDGNSAIFSTRPHLSSPLTKVTLYRCEEYQFPITV